jgi:hypothetical protein
MVSHDKAWEIFLSNPGGKKMCADSVYVDSLFVSNMVFLRTAPFWDLLI